MCFRRRSQNNRSSFAVQHPAVMFDADSCCLCVSGKRGVSVIASMSQLLTCRVCRWGTLSNHQYSSLSRFSRDGRAFSPKIIKSDPDPLVNAAIILGIKREADWWLPRPLSKSAINMHPLPVVKLTPSRYNPGTSISTRYLTHA